VWRTLAAIAMLAGGDPRAAPLRLPTPRSYLSVAAVRGRVYAIGGLDDSSGGLYHATGAVEVLDPAARTWTAGEPMPTPRFSAAAAAIGDRIYVVGGHVDEPAGPGRSEAGNPNSNRVEAYDVPSNRWTIHQGMLTPRCEPAVAAFKGKLLAFGGTDGRAYLDSTEAYDPATDAWTAKAAMPRERKGGGAVVAAGRVFLLGGIRGDGRAVEEIDIYDPATDTWSVSPARLPRGVWLASAVAVGGSIVLAGGSFQGEAEEEMTDFPAIRAYDVATARWSVAGALAVARSTHGAAVIGGKLYVVGGCREGCNVKVPEVEVISLGNLATSEARRVASRSLAKVDGDGPVETCPFADSATGLCWQNPPSGRTYARSEGIAYCEQLADRGFTDWRLPTVDELLTLVRGKDMSSCAAADPGCLDSSCGAKASCSAMGPRLPNGRCYWPNGLTGTCSWYHSSSTVGDARYDAWFISFDRASLQWGAGGIGKYVRCVRGERRQIAK